MNSRQWPQSNQIPQVNTNSNTEGEIRQCWATLNNLIQQFNQLVSIQGGLEQQIQFFKEKLATLYPDLGADDFGYISNTTLHSWPHDNFTLAAMVGGSSTTIFDVVIQGGTPSTTFTAAAGAVTANGGFATPGIVDAAAYKVAGAAGSSNSGTGQPTFVNGIYMGGTFGNNIPTDGIGDCANDTLVHVRQYGAWDNLATYLPGLVRNTAWTGSTDIVKLGDVTTCAGLTSTGYIETGQYNSGFIGSILYPVEDGDPYTTYGTGFKIVNQAGTINEFIINTLTHKCSAANFESLGYLAGGVWHPGTFTTTYDGGFQGSFICPSPNVGNTGIITIKSGAGSEVAHFDTSDLTSHIVTLITPNGISAPFIHPATDGNCGIKNTSGDWVFECNTSTYVTTLVGNLTVSNAVGNGTVAASGFYGAFLRPASDTGANAIVIGTHGGTEMMSFNTTTKATSVDSLISTNEVAASTFKGAFLRPATDGDCGIAIAAGNDWALRVDTSTKTCYTAAIVTTGTITGLNFKGAFLRPDADGDCGITNTAGDTWKFRVNTTENHCYADKLTVATALIIPVV